VSLFLCLCLCFFLSLTLTLSLYPSCFLDALATACHELRNPLHAIVGMLDLVKDDMKSSPVNLSSIRSGLAAIAGSTKQMQRLVNDVLDYAKLESGSMELIRNPV
jgi:signal transduction histidine kinase